LNISLLRVVAALQLAVEAAQVDSVQAPDLL